MAEAFKTQDYYAMVRDICPELDQSTDAAAVSSKSSVEHCITHIIMRH